MKHTGTNFSSLGRAMVGAAALGLVMGSAAYAQQYDQQQYQHTPEQQTQQQYEQDRQQAAQQMQRGERQVQQAIGVDTASAIVVGEVVETRDVNISQPAKASHRLIKVESANGRTAIVDIGNAGEYGDLSFNRGDRIIAVGKQGRINREPVIFAKSVGELHSVGRHMTKEGQLTQSRQATANPQNQQNRQAQQNQTLDTDATIYYFTTENYATDEYGVYDEDFYWETDEPWYADWNANTAWTDDYESAHYGMFGYDDAGEWGLWDW